MSAVAIWGPRGNPSRVAKPPLFPGWEKVAVSSYYWYVAMHSKDSRTFAIIKRQVCRDYKVVVLIGDRSDAISVEYATLEE